MLVRTSGSWFADQLAGPTGSRLLPLFGRPDSSHLLFSLLRRGVRPHLGCCFLAALSLGLAISVVGGGPAAALGLGELGIALFCAAGAGAGGHLGFLFWCEGLDPWQQGLLSGSNAAAPGATPTVQQVIGPNLLCPVLWTIEIHLTRRQRVNRATEVKLRVRGRNLLDELTLCELRWNGELLCRYKSIVSKKF